MASADSPAWHHASGLEKPDFDDTLDPFHGPAKFVELALRLTDWYRAGVVKRYKPVELASQPQARFSPLIS
jgi:hypothetical protein